MLTDRRHHRPPEPPLPSSDEPVRFRIPLGGRRSALALWAAIAVVVTLSAGTQVLDRLVADSSAVRFLSELFHVDEEQSLPTLFSVLLLLACSATLATVAAVSRRQHRPDAGRWAIVSGLFAALAVDEHLSLHERLIEPVRDGLDVGGAFHFAWVIPAMALVAVLTALFAPFVWRLPGDVRALVVIAAATYLAGAVGAEMAAGWQVDRGDQPFRGLVTSEEGLEMAGAALMLLAARRHLRDHLGGAEVALRIAR